MPQQVGPYEVLSMDECGKYLGRDVNNFRQDYKTLGVPNLRIGGRVWFPIEEVDKWVRQQVHNRVEHERCEQAAFKSLDERRGAR